MSYYENFYVADVFVANSSGNKVDVLPEKALFVTWANPNQAPDVSGPIPPEKIASKIKSRAKWATFFGSLSAALASQTANVNTSTQGKQSQPWDPAAWRAESILRAAPRQ